MLKKIIVLLTSLFLTPSVNAKDALLLYNIENDLTAKFYNDEKSGVMKGEIILESDGGEKDTRLEFEIPSDLRLYYHRSSPAVAEFLPEGEKVANFNWTKMLTFSESPVKSKGLDELFMGFKTGMGAAYNEDAIALDYTAPNCKQFMSRATCFTFSNPFASRNEIICARAFETNKGIWMVQYEAEISEQDDPVKMRDELSKYLINGISCK